MPQGKSSGTRTADRMSAGLAALGAAITLAGLGFDLVPGASPGVSAPQLAMIAGGAVCAAAGLLLRHGRTRARIRRGLGGSALRVVLVLAATLLGLELALALAGQQTYFPAEPPATFLSPVPWWTCDTAGCHYDYEDMLAACARGDARGRRCIVNRQGFHDTQDFAAGDDRDGALRVLVLGDSFAFGGSADLGLSFVEAIERHFPQAVVWNTAIPGAGTNQALMSFEAFAPILQPQATILGFFMNDFDDNMMPVDSYFMGADAAGRELAIRQYQIDRRGNLLKLDEQSDLYYRYHSVDPPANESHRLLGTTRLGSLALRTLDAAMQMISKAEGARVQAQVAATRPYLAALSERAAAARSELIVLLIPRQIDLAAPGPLYKHALRLVDELGIAYIDMRGSLEDKDYAPYPDVHWSNAGHQKAGARLIVCLEALRETGTFSSCGA